MGRGAKARKRMDTANHGIESWPVRNPIAGFRGGSRKRHTHLRALFSQRSETFRQRLVVQKQTVRKNGELQAVLDNAFRKVDGPRDDKRFSAEKRYACTGAMHAQHIIDNGKGSRSVDFLLARHARVGAAIGTSEIAGVGQLNLHGRRRRFGRSRGTSEAVPTQRIH